MELGFLLLLLPIATFSLPRSESEQGESSQLSDIQAHWLTNVSMEINFPNDTTYTILLSPSTNIPGVSTPCLFSGQLQLDQRSVVAVTGCLDSNETTMSIASRLMPGGLLDLVIVNGSTFIIEDDASIRGRRQIREVARNDYLIPPLNPNPVSPLSESDIYLPKSVSLQTSIIYDNTLLNLFDGSHQKTKDWINKVVGLAEPLLRHPSLDTAIHLKVTGEAKHLNDYLRADRPTVERLVYSRKYRKNTSFFCADILLPGSTDDIGIAYNGSYCMDNGFSININEYYTHNNSDVNTARTFVHELGHNVGMLHDFDDVHGGFGSSCNNQGLMSYGDFPDKWSTCSNKDFKKWYNDYGHVCLGV